MLYIPLFQSCILNFVEKMQEYHEIDMTEVIPQNFLTLAVSMKALDETIIRAKYPEEIASKMIMFNQQLEPMIAENNQAFAIKIEHLHFLTKDRSQATSFVHVDKNAEVGVKIIKELKDPNNTHKYTMKNAIKENEKYCYVHRQYAQPSYTYSMQAIEMIVDEIAKEPENIVEYLKRTKK